MVGYRSFEELTAPDAERPALSTPTAPVVGGREPRSSPPPGSGPERRPAPSRQGSEEALIGAPRERLRRPLRLAELGLRERRFTARFSALLERLEGLTPVAEGFWLREPLQRRETPLEAGVLEAMTRRSTELLAALPVDTQLWRVALRRHGLLRRASPECLVAGLSVSPRAQLAAAGEGRVRCGLEELGAALARLPTVPGERFIVVHATTGWSEAARATASCERDRVLLVEAEGGSRWMLTRLDAGPWPSGLLELESDAEQQARGERRLSSHSDLQSRGGFVFATELEAELGLRPGILARAASSLEARGLLPLEARTVAARRIVQHRRLEPPSPAS